ncbi:MAG: hypothetical protein ACR2IT_12370 [Pirellulales bacterium]
MTRTLLIRCTVLVAMAAAAADAAAIEMFTYFGDGSRIGLPSLEVPIEAYPGIPLRSDRLRAKRRAVRGGPGSAVRVGPGTPVGGGITIRSMPALPEPSAAPSAAPTAETILPPLPQRQVPAAVVSEPTTGRPAAN